MKYTATLIFLALGLAAQAGRKEMPEFNSLVVAGNATVFLASDDYPGYIDVEGPDESITSVWSDSNLVLVVNGNPPTAIRISSNKLSMVSLSANATLIAEGGIEAQNLVLSGADQCTFKIPRLKAENVTVSLVMQSSIEMRKLVCRDLGLSITGNSSMDISGLECGKVDAVAGDNSVINLSGRCGKKNIVLINEGVINTKGLIEDGVSYVSKDMKESNSSPKTSISVNIP